MNKKLALIVEDDTLLSNLFSRALSDIGYATLVMEDGRKASDWLEEKAPHLILLDMHLPHISGIQILKEIRSNPRFDNTYIAVVTADANMGDMAGEKADFVLNKPVDIPQLQQMAERLKVSRNSIARNGY
jgi:two-component system cell cycle response regulator DivK